MKRIATQRKPRRLEPRRRRPAARSGRRRRRRRRRGASPAACPAPAARAAGPCARARRRRGRSSCASASRPLANGSTRAGSCVETRNVRSPRSSASCASRSSAPASSSARVRLVEDEQRGIVEQDAAEREPLRHAARVRRDAVVPRLPEPEALEQHPDPLAPLGHAVEAAVELEVLERRQLAIDERLVAEVAELAARDAPLDRPLGRRARPAQIRSSVVLPEPFGPVTTRKPPSRAGRDRRRAGRASRRSACRAVAAVSTRSG